jgi:hypothetical protein
LDKDSRDKSARDALLKCADFLLDIVKSYDSPGAFLDSDDTRDLVDEAKELLIEVVKC